MDFWKNIEIHLNDLTPAEKKVYVALLNNPYPFHTFSGSRVAEEFKLPQASITRFVKKIGYDSYADFRMALAMSENNSKKVATGVTSLEKSILDNVTQVRQIASESLLDILTDKIMKAHHVYLMGTGNSYISAYQLMVKLTISKIQSTLVNPNFEVQQLFSMTNTDLIIMYSHANPTYKIFLQAINDLPKEKRPYTVLVCSSKKHPIKKKVDLCIELPTIITPNTISQANEVPPVSFNLFLSEHIVKKIRSKKQK